MVETEQQNDYRLPAAGHDDLKLSDERSQRTLSPPPFC